MSEKRKNDGERRDGREWTPADAKRRALAEIREIGERVGRGGPYGETGRRILRLVGLIEKAERDASREDPAPTAVLDEAGRGPATLEAAREEAGRGVRIERTFPTTELVQRAVRSTGARELALVIVELLGVCSRHRIGGPEVDEARDLFGLPPANPAGDVAPAAAVEIARAAADVALERKETIARLRKILSRTADASENCSFCGVTNPKPRGHAPGCELAAAIAGEGSADR